MNARALTRFAAKVAENPELALRVKANPVDALREEAGNLTRIENALASDRWVYRIVVLTLGSSLICTTVGAIVLAAMHPKEDVPQILIAIVSGSIGALAGLLAPSPAKNDPPPDP